MTTNKLNLSRKEKDILESYEADEWQTLENLETEIMKYQEYAKETIMRKEYDFSQSVKNPYIKKSFAN